MAFRYHSCKWNDNERRRYLEEKMCEKVKKVSPLDRLVAAAKELEASAKNAITSDHVVGQANGQVRIHSGAGSLFFSRDDAKKVADAIYQLLGEDE